MRCQEKYRSFPAFIEPAEYCGIGVLLFVFVRVVG